MFFAEFSKESELIAPKPKLLEAITLRPHHFLCTVGFRGKGYSTDFTENFSLLKEHLDNNPKTKIIVKTATDHVCGPCPHNQGDGSCVQEERVQSLDDKHRSILHLEEGAQLTWAEGINLIKTYMTPDQFHYACEGCEWRTLGICEEALIDLIDDREVQIQ